MASMSTTEYCPECKKGIMQTVVDDWCGENPEKWHGGRIHMVDKCDECGHREEYNLDGM